MCGIAGIWGEANEALIRRMTDELAHRGPDDAGILVCPEADPPVSLGHRRLSIIDLSEAGHQPMSNEEGTIWVVYNGEIYNFPELRQQLLAKGHQFRSRSDTEVLVHGFEEWGLDLVRRLNGIFAFALWDKLRSELHLARDRFGVKPLCYVEQGGRILFASEIKSLLCDERISREIDDQGLLSFVQFRYCPEPMSLFRAVRRVAPGHVLSFHRAENPNSWCYHQLEFNECAGRVAEQDLVQWLSGTMVEAVHRQMISDVPVGLFLSGGVDSSGLLAMVRQFNQERLKTFTIGFRREDQKFEQQPDDVHYARELARQFDTDHQEIILEPRIVDLLPRVIWHLDDPIADPAAITSYLICQAARQGGTQVLLSGQGGDEVFGGYPWHLAGHLAKGYRAAPRLLRHGTEKLLEQLPAARGGRWTGTFRRLRKFSANASRDFEQGQIGFLSYASADNLSGLLGERFGHQLEDGLAEQAHRAWLEQSRGWHSMNRMLHLDMGTFLPSLNLAYTDRTSMAFGVEVRVPYLDNDVVAFMAAVPHRYKIHGLRRKYLMKRALESCLPSEILHRQKAGFGAPIRTWIVSDLKEMIGDLLSESALRRRGYFNPAYVQRLIQENAAGRHDYNYLIYTLLSFELWCQVYQDGRCP